MIYSMTGYGAAKGEAGGIAVSVELKSVNNRYLDVSVHLPRNVLFAEEAIKAGVSERVSRGKVDVFVSLESASEDALTVSVNRPLAEGYLNALKELASGSGIPISVLAQCIPRFSDVITVEKKEPDREAAVGGIALALSGALEEFNAMRCREGERLARDVEARLETIETLVSEVERLSPQTVLAYRERLSAKLAEILENRAIDEQRVLTEAAVFADKVAVDEETVRLRSHIAQLREMLASGSPIGRKLDFLIQEFNREANTIGSKCTDSAVARVVVDLKSEIEKIREQIQNIE